MKITTYLSIIPLNVNGLNSPIKRHMVADWIKKRDPYIRCFQETHFRTKDTPDWKWGDRKRYLVHMEMKRGWGSNTHIRQNRLSQ